MLKCVMGKCSNEVTGGFKPEVDGLHAGAYAKVKEAWSATYWCKEHESNLSRKVSGPGREFTENEIHILRKAS